MLRLSIKASLISVFSLIILLCGIMGYVSSTGLSSTNGSTTEIATNWLPSVQAANQINTATSDFRVAEGSHVMSTTDQDMTKAEADMKAAGDHLAALQKQYEPLISSDQERQYYQQFTSEWTKYLDLHQKLLVLSRANKNEEAANLFKIDMRIHYDQAGGSLDQIIEINRKGAEAAYANSQSAFSSTQSISFTVLGLVGLTLFGSMYFVVFGISKPINAITASMSNLAKGDTDTTIPFGNRADEISSMAGALEVFRQAAIDNKRMEHEDETNRKQAETNRIADHARAEAEAAERMRIATSGLAAGMKRLAAGDLSFQLTETFAADFEGLRQDFNVSVSQLADTLKAVAQSVITINNGSQEISSGTNDLSKRTEQQAAALEETAAALDQITVNVTSSSKRAEEARQVASQANLAATKSGEVVAQAVSAMSRIEGSSNQISNIIGVIDEIAFQTNLLALNAGVEAARAGEAGKGFAVVAQEVRELAQRSAAAAKEIKRLIQTSSAEVSTGVKLVSETGEALKSIGEFIVNINGHMESIATSAREQSTGLAEVNTAVNQMDQVTQQNAAMVEESSAAAGSLANEANSLGQLIEQFDLGQTNGQARALRQTAQRMAASASSHNASRQFARQAPRQMAQGNAAVSQEWSEF